MKRAFLAIIALSLCCTTVPCLAAGDLEYAVTPYVFLPALDLDSTVAGQTVPIDMSFGDVWDEFDLLAFAVRGEIWQDEVGGVTDFYYADLSTDAGPNNQTRVNIRDWYWDLLAGYRWVQEGEFRRPASLDLTGGVRIHYLKQEINPVATPKLGDSETFVDIMLGARGMYPLADSWLLSARGDIGGFDLTDGTKLNYSLTGGVGWEFTRDWLALLGYRIYGIDYETGKGLSNFGLDGIEHGLWLGVSYAPQSK